MWILLARQPRPDARQWPGRRGLAVADAIAWPLAWVVAVGHAPAPMGIVGQGVMAVALLCAAGRLHRALWLNHRYRFTTWRWGRVVMALWLVGVVLKWGVPG